MYGTKRVAKRSIVGTRVCAQLPQNQDRIFYPGTISNVVQNGPSNSPDFTVRFDDGTAKDYKETEIVGHAFLGIASVHLKFGQKVYFTMKGRETLGYVQKHKKPTDEVFIKIEDEVGTLVQRKIDEVRLMESRKSARLVDVKPASVCLSASESKKRAVSSSIDVPSAKSQKMEEEPPMDDVMAAMVLTSLSASPQKSALDCGSAPPISPVSPTGGTTTGYNLGTSYSPSSSGHFSWDFLSSRGTPSPTSSSSDVESNATVPPSLTDLIGSTNGLVFSSSVDEGIGMGGEVGALCVIDEKRNQATSSPTKTVYKCTWSSCCKILGTVQGIEKHIRTVHLGSKDNCHRNDHEEEFYFTEIQTTVDSMSDMFANMNTSCPTVPELTARNQQEVIAVATKAGQLRVEGQRISSLPMPTHQASQPQRAWQMVPRMNSSHSNGQTSSNPLRTKAPSLVQQRQHYHQAASPKTHLHFTTATPTVGSPSPSHPHHTKTREGKKCRKVYGMDKRDQWCTQCRWKKACVRFTHP